MRRRLDIITMKFHLILTTSYGMLCYGMCSAVQYSTVQYSTVQYCTVQYCTVQYSAAQHTLNTRSASFLTLAAVQPWQQSSLYWPCGPDRQHKTAKLCRCKPSLSPTPFLFQQ